MKRISVALFGGPVVEVVESSASLSPFEAYLVALVFGHGSGGLSRRRATELLWGVDEGHNARHRLSQLLYRLTAKVDGSRLVCATPDRLSALAKGVRCDLAEFHRALHENRLAEAERLMSCGFLVNLESCPTADFELWKTAKTATLRRQLRDGAAALWSQSEPAGNWKAARIAAGVLRSLEPGNEQALRRFMVSEAMAGQVHEARAAYDAFSDHKAAEGPPWVPESETLELLRRIRSLDPGPEVVSHPLHVDPEPEPPLCGRDAELALLRSYVATIPDDETICVLLSGEGGIGKTRLVEEALVAATLSGITSLRGRSSEFEREIPLNPLLEAFDHPAVERALTRLEDPWRTVMLALMPQFHTGQEALQDLGYIQPGSIPRRLFESVHRLLLEVVEEQPVCLFIDDLHWADETTLTVLEFLRRRWTTGGLTMVFAVRPEILMPGTPWTRFRNELVASRVVQAIDLDELTDTAATALIDAVTEPTLPRDVVRELRSLSGNNPFFLIELALEYVAGRFRPHVELGDELPVPLSIRQVFEQRLGRLSETATDIAAALAIVNKPYRTGDLVSLGLGSIRGCRSGLAELAQLRLIRSEGGYATLRHPLLRECVIGRLPRITTSWFHLQVAKHLEASEGDAPEELVLHFDRGGAVDKAIEYGWQAAARAEANGAIPEALQYLSIVRRNSKDDSDLTAVLARLGHLNYLHRNLEEAGPLLRLASHRMHHEGDPQGGLEAETLALDAESQRNLLSVEQVLSELSRIGEAAQVGQHWRARARCIDVRARLLERGMRFDQLASFLLSARTLVGEGPPQARCWIYAALAFSGKTEPTGDPLAAIRQGIGIARDAGLRAELFTLLSRLIAVMIPLGLLGGKEGSAALAEAEILARDSGDLFQKFNISLNHGVWLMETGNPQAARARLVESAKIVAKTKATTAQVILDYNLGELSLREGDFETALEPLLRAERNWALGAPEYGRHLISAAIGLCHLELGGLRSAERRAETLMPDQDFWLFNPLIIMLLRARLLRRHGKRGAAADYLSDRASELREGRITTWVHLKFEEAGLRRGLDRTGAKRLVEELEPVVQLGGFRGLASRLATLNASLS